MKRKIKSTVSMFLAVIMVMNCIYCLGFSVSAAATRTIYFKNNVGWDYVNYFMWGKGIKNQPWPGTVMEHIGNNIWKCSVTASSDNIIFNNGSSGAGNQTDDLIIPGDNYIYDGLYKTWSEYSLENPPEITADKENGCQFKDTLNFTIFAANAESSYYTINGGDKVSFKESASAVVGENANFSTSYTVYVYSENQYGKSEQTFVYNKIVPIINTVSNTAVPDFAEKNALYAHAQTESENKQAWQIWETQSGPSSEKGVYYFFLPPTANDNEVELYNSFDNSVLINGYEILPNTSAVVKYTSGKATVANVDNTDISFPVQIYKSDSEVSLFINDTSGSYKGNDGQIYNTDLYSFLVSDKENEVKGSSCTIIDENGINDTTLKKIKGRGNSTWRDSDKKPFNINFDNKTDIGGISSKKFCLLANAKDGTLLRNRIMYDLADEVGSLYSSDSRSVDLYINGSYKGAYQITQKVELGKNSLVSLKDESDKLTENFNFLIEVDIWNYADEVNFVSKKGLHVSCKSPDLEGYDGVDPTLNAQYNYIKGKYQMLEDALYSGNMADLEKICDIDSLARAYLLQEFGKNCDGGMTSCFFTYVAADGKFIADPIWDCDSTLGNVNCTRQNASNTADPYNWAIKTAQYDRTNMTNIIGQAFNTKGTTSDNETFEDVVKRLWINDFIPAISVLKGQASAEGSRLKSIEQYKNISYNSYNINYIKWKHQWFPYSWNYMSGDYSKDFDGQVQYMYDWLVKREDWINKQFISEFIMGDIDLNGNVDIIDATLLQKHIASLIVLNPLQLEQADMKLDKIIDIDDVTEIQKYIAGIA